VNKRMPGLYDEWLATHPPKPKPNPMLRRYGAGPEGKRCKDCAHFFRKHFAKVYRKCAKRGDTNGPATDHLATWPACGAWEPKGQEEAATG
jgi:hypothetical protein